MFKPLIAVVMLLAATPAFAAETPLTAARYAQQLGVGMDVDWARTERGIREFDPLVVRDFSDAGIRHVRIRVAARMTEARLIHLRKLVEACEVYGVIPIIAYQAEEFKAQPGAKNEAQLVAWWATVGKFFARQHPLLGFDVIDEPGEKLNRDLPALNRAYANVIKTLHTIDPQRMIFIAPQMRAAPEDLKNLKLPAHSQNYLLAQWHILASGVSKNGGKSPWTTGTAAEKSAIRARINSALRWQQKTGHASWVGSWAVGEAIKSAPGAAQMAFARFLACELKKAQIPYAISSDTQFYDGEEGAWRPALQPLLQEMMAADCEKPGAKPDLQALIPPVHGAPGAKPAAASTAQSAARPASSASRY